MKPEPTNTTSEQQAQIRAEAEQLAEICGAEPSPASTQAWQDYRALFRRALNQGRVWTPERIRVLYPTLREIVDEIENLDPADTPRHREPTECHDPYLLFDDEDWLIFIEPALCDNPEAADSFAHLLFVLKEAIESGPAGVSRAGYTLSDGIRLVYKYTETHKASLKLYTLSLTGRLKSADEPMKVIPAAIERGMDEIERIAAIEHSAENKRSRQQHQRRRKRRPR